MHAGNNSAFGGLVLNEEQKKMIAARPVAPEYKAGFLSKMYFNWVSPLMSKGQKKALEVEDVWNLQSGDKSRDVHKRWREAWRSPGGGSTYGTLKLVFKRPYLIAGLCKFINSTFQLVPSVALMLLLQYFEDVDNGVPVAERGEWWVGLIYALITPVVYVIRSIFENQYFHMTMRIGMQARASVAAAVYHKSLTLAPSERQQFTSGQMLNLLQLDASRVEAAVERGHVMWDGAYQILLYVAALIYYIGPSALVGLAIMILLVPLQGMMMMKLGGFRKRSAKVTDTRVKIENEALQTIRAVKLYNWEAPITAKAEANREKELSIFKSSAVLNAMNSTFMSTAPVLVAVGALFVYASVAEDGDFKPSRVFAALALFGQLRFPLIMYPWAISIMADFKVSLKRLDKFLTGEDMEGAEQMLLSDAPAADKANFDSPSAVSFSHVTAFWAKEGKKKKADEKKADGAAAAAAKGGAEGAEDGKKEEEEEEEEEAGPVLTDVSFDVPRGELFAIIGPVGSGKSSVIAALLNELHRTQGTVQVAGSIAYVAQTSWIQNKTLKDNVLFGHAYNERWYKQVTKMCQLQPDIDVLPDGDNTMIGERGINLSGGQKARVALARAVYSKADIVVLDDPLSALDAEVGRAVFEECITRGLAGKTRILVTNQLHVVPSCDRVLILEPHGQRGGKVTACGTYPELMSEGLDFATLMASFGFEAPTEAEAEAEENKDGADRERSASLASRGRSGSIGEPKKEAKKPKAKMMKEEERSTGAVALGVYLRYIKAGSSFKFSVMMFMYLMGQVFSLAGPYVVSMWTSDPFYKDQSMGFYMGLYAAAGLLTGLLSFTRTIISVYFSVTASKTLHNNLLARILRAPVSFFDTTPIGRIVSRFSKDMDQLDQGVSQALGFSLMFVWNLIGTLIAIISQTWLIVFALIPWTFVYWKLSVYFRNISREMKRLDSITRSPVYAQYSETLGGLSTIRAFNYERRFVNEHYDAVDVNHSCWFSMRTADRWLAMRMELMSAVILVLVGVLSLWGVHDGTLTAAFAGFALSLSLAVIGMLSFMVRVVAQMENAMNSVERILYYTDTTPEEPPQVVDAASGVVAPASWPSAGSIEFNEVTMRYRKNTPVVLKNLTFTIKGGEKVGIVGRSGCGKSSILQVLFRMTEPEGGVVKIDGIDTSKLGLSQLRSNLSIIPQDPPLLAGTVRTNLDPFDQFRDEELWAALERVELADVIRSGELSAKAKEAAADKGGKGKPAAKQAAEEDASLPTGLSSVVAEHGANFSAGQRQLLCLARVLVRRNKVLVLDEATSSVDMESDAKIQTTIRQEFADCTIIAIAHRLNTIIDSDRVLVIDDGAVAEFDTPHNLLQNRDSLLFRLVAETGEQQAEQLAEQAARAHLAATEGEAAAPASE